MANKALPLLALGAGALLLMSRKKKTTPVPPTKDEEELPVSNKLQFDKECEALLQRLDVKGYDARMTNKYLQLRNEGVEDLDEITLEILKMDAPHCPWEDPTSYTKQMNLTYNAQLAAIKNYAEMEERGEFD